jgi:hypothetical protein
VKPLTKSAGLGRIAQLVMASLVASLPLACTGLEPEAPNPMLGEWMNSGHDKIGFRPTTLVLEPNGIAPTPMDAAACAGKFGFGYETKSRDALIALIARQSDLRGELSGMLVQPDYPVAELLCDHGYNTYVLLGDRSLVAIYRDGDIAGIERLSRL